METDVSFLGVLQAVLRSGFLATESGLGSGVATWLVLHPWKRVVSGDYLICQWKSRECCSQRATLKLKGMRRHSTREALEKVMGSSRMGQGRLA